LFAVWESWDKEEEGEIGEERVGRIGIYYFVCESVGYSDGKQGTSLYRDFSLNPSVILSAFQMVNRSRHHTKLPF
jgi:hypothetical protein